MTVETFFHLDCSAIIPACRYTCPRCIQELTAVIGSLPGVSYVSMGKRGEGSGVIVRHDADAIDVDRLMDAFRELPSFNEGRFVPEALDGPQEQPAI